MWLELILVLLVVVLLWRWQRGSRFNRLMSKFPGPRPYPIVGNALQIGTSSSILNYIELVCKKYRSPIAIWIGNRAHILLTDPNDIEIILSSSNHLDKGDSYRFVQPLFRTGLVVSPVPIWRKHRKILNSTFNMKLLQSFVDVFNANGEILVEKLRQEIGGPGFDVHYYVGAYTLDVIFESALGVKINAQLDREGEYVKAVHTLADLVMKQVTKPWYGNAFLFSITGLKKLHDRCLQTCITLVTKVIKTRKEEITNERASRHVAKSDDVSQSDGAKKNLAFLDTMIESTFNESGLTDEEILDEVNTFMFAGTETSASAISFALWVLSWHQAIQDKVFQELKEVFPDPGEPLTFRGLQELKYMECVIKETLRLYPTGPIFARQLTEDVQLDGGLIAPKNATIAFPVFMIHRNPEIFPDPLRFDPDRFLPENVRGRHPYAYIPFSAGPRNCIGQKYAMLELKHALALILRAYTLLPGTEEPNLVLDMEITLMSKTGCTVKIVPRNN